MLAFGYISLQSGNFWVAGPNFWALFAYLPHYRCSLCFLEWLTLLIVDGVGVSLSIPAGSLGLLSLDHQMSKPNLFGRRMFCISQRAKISGLVRCSLNCLCSISNFSIPSVLM